MPSGGGDPYAILDTLVNTYIDTVIAGWNNAHGFEATILALIVCAILLFSGLAVIVIATAFLILCELFMAILLSLAPIFIVLALFPQTRNYTSLWISQVVNYGLLLVVVSVVVSLLIMFLTGVVVPTTANMDWSFAFQVAIISGVFVVILLAVPAFASALSGGAFAGGFTGAKNTFSSYMPKRKEKQDKGGGGDKGGKGGGNSIKAENKGK